MLCVMETFWSSDIHFGHKNIITYCDRPFSDVDEMNECLIQNWNSTVGLTDEVWFLGDFSMGRKSDSVRYFRALNGKKHLVQGNHDGKETLNLPWESVSQLKEVTVSNHKFVMCHFPLEVWNRSHHGVLHLHGHSHGSLQRVIPRRMDVGVDCHPEYRPFSLEEVVERLAGEEYKMADHHGDRRETGQHEDAMV